VTHQAFLIEDGDPGITLLSLPTAKVSQIDSSMVTSVVSSIPNDPEGNPWYTQADPYAVAGDICHNLGYAMDDTSRWLVQVDLTKFQANPSTISTALPSGNCKGTSTTFACDNGNGVKFFPLPPVT
jgi:hypothetical protein